VTRATGGRAADRGPLDLKRMMRAGCDNTTVGVLITGDDGRYLMSVRPVWPAGIAPPAGHVFDWDRAGSYPDAARALVAAELRLSVKTLDQASEGWRADRCGRPPGPRGTGHDWQVFTATVTGTVNAARRRARTPRWLDAGEIQQLAGRTADYAHGRVSDGQFYARPGIRPVWVAVLAELGIITVTGPDLAVIGRVAESGGLL
jgi:hypothetical protein